MASTSSAQIANVLQEKLAEAGFSPFEHKVHVKFSPYCFLSARDLVKAVKKEFGKTGIRYQWGVVGEPDDRTPNIWVLEFRFKDPYDAMIFGLKYAR